MVVPPHGHGGSVTASGTWQPSTLGGPPATRLESAHRQHPQPQRPGSLHSGGFPVFPLVRDAGAARCCLTLGAACVCPRCWTSAATCTWCGTHAVRLADDFARWSGAAPLAVEGQQLVHLVGRDPRGPGLTGPPVGEPPSAFPRTGPPPTERPFADAPIPAARALRPAQPAPLPAPVDVLELPPSPSLQHLRRRIHPATLAARSQPDRSRAMENRSDRGAPPGRPPCWLTNHLQYRYSRPSFPSGATVWRHSRASWRGGRVVKGSRL